MTAIYSNVPVLSYIDIQYQSWLLQYIEHAQLYQIVYEFRSDEQ